jgi:8-oxo-dGTP diphosphatase
MSEVNNHIHEYYNPAATVTAVVFRYVEDKIEVLLTLRAIEPFRNKWCLPGGHIDKFEQAYEAIVREIHEETGLDFEGEYFGIFDEIFENLEIHNVVTAYAGSGTGDLIQEQSEVSKIEWISLNEACNMELAFNHNKVLNVFKKWYEGKTLNNRTDGLLEEFRALRGEMTTIFNARLWGTATYLLLVVGIISGLGGKPQTFHWLFLIFASIPFILHTAFRERARIRAGVYIKEKIEPYIPGLDWERFVDKWRAFGSYNEKKSIVDRIFHMIGIGGLYILVIVVSVFKCIESIYPNLSNFMQSNIAVLIFIAVGSILAFFAVLKFFKLYQKAEDKTKDVCSSFWRNRLLEKFWSKK